MDDPKRLSLYELQSLVKRGVAEAHPMPYWVAAEIGELKVNATSGHCYIELVEKADGGAVPRARASAVIWRDRYALIEPYFRSTTGAALRAGIRVLVKVSVGYHELYGMSFRITDIEPSYTLGDLAARRRETIERLRREGVYDMNRQTDLPEAVQRLAVVSSAGAAGYQDFMNELSAGGYAYRVVLFAAVMQGLETEGSVIDALDRIASRMDEFDAVVVIRGGGAQSDLAAFDSYRLASHVAQFPLPVLTGIGHDKDESVADVVAHTALKTPTAVAAFLGARNAAFEAGLDERMTRIAALAEGHLRRGRQRVVAAAYALRSMVVEQTYRAARGLSALSAAVREHSRAGLSARRARIERLAAAATHAPALRLAAAAGALKASQSLLADRAAGFFSVRRAALLLAESRLEGRNPERILRMGYAVVRDAAGRLVRGPGEVSPGDRLDIHLPGGMVETEVKKIKTQ